MVKDYIKIHDQFAFELKLEFPVRKIKKDTENYNFEMYLFIPHSLDVNKQNYLREHFYRSLKTNIRLTSPLFKLKELLDDEGTPLTQLEERIEKYKNQPNELNLQSSIEQLKKYCSVFGSAMRHASYRITRAKDLEARNKMIVLFTDQIKQLRARYHKQLAPLSNQENLKTLLREYRFADEYQSLQIESQIFSLIQNLQNKKDSQKEVTALLHQLVEKEMDYRDMHDYPSVTKPKRTNEDVLHRKSRLKKYIESNLFLNTETRQEGVVTEQILFSIAAGLAMVFATAVAFASQMLYGSLTIPFFIALVVGYMFKDRIKEWARVYLDKKRKKIHADFKTVISGQHGTKIGYLKESFHFELKSHLPSEVNLAREMMRITEMGDVGLGDNIIGYKNKTTLFINKIEKDKYSGITQILRFNISDFTLKMDDPEKEVFVKTKKGIKRMLADRVYHLNLVLKYESLNKTEIKSYKIKASRNGIKNIERYKV